MATKKPKIYTATGKARKPAAVKAAAPKGLTDEYAEAAKSSRPVHSSKHWQDLLKSAEALNQSRELFYAAMLGDVAARTIKLWFGYSLVRPAKK